eukprot:gene13747-15183_t
MFGAGNANEKLFTKEELAKYGALVTTTDKIYLAILGKVFDVSAGKRHYGKGGSYSFFTGIDGTKAFVTGDFNKEGLIDDITGLKDEQCLSLSEWQELYFKDYTYLGKVIGNFYDENGFETPALKEFDVKLQQALQDKANDEEEKKVFPHCNSEWSEKDGTVLWCSNQSGGIKRDWAGLPRKFFKPGQTDHRCACVNENNLKDKRLRVYPGCSAESVSCKAK